MHQVTQARAGYPEGHDDQQLNLRKEIIIFQLKRNLECTPFSTSSSLSDPFTGLCALEETRRTAFGGCFLTARRCGLERELRVTGCLERLRLRVVPLALVDVTGIAKDAN